jgi:hypothetical protein
MDLSGVRVARSLVFSVVFCRSLFVFLPPFLLTIVVSVLLLFTHSDNPFGIFQLFLKENEQMLSSDATKFDPTWTQIHGTRVEHANNYTTDVVNISGFYANTRHNIIN